MSNFSRKIAGRSRRSRKDRLRCTKCNSTKLIRAAGMFHLAVQESELKDDWDTIQCVSCEHIFLIKSSALED